MHIILIKSSRNTKLIVNLLCALLKRTGQGEDECFISQPQAILYSFVLPVALLMIFNLFALGHTVVHIIKTRKVTEIIVNNEFHSVHRTVGVK